MDSELPQTKPGSKHNYGIDLTVGSIPRHLILFALPLLAGNVLQTAYSFINAIWVGNYLGVAAMAAVTNTFPVIFVLMAVGNGLTMAANILVAQYYGAGKNDKVKLVVQTSFVLLAGLAVICLGLGELAVGTLLKLMSVPPDVMPLAQPYLHLVLLTLPGMFGFFLLSSLLRGVGDSTTPLKFMAASVITNAILDPLLILGLAGFPKLGLNGTAYASIFCQYSALLALLYYMRRKAHILAPDWKHLKVDWEMAVTTFKVGLPASVQQSLISLGMLFVISFVNGFGEAASAAFGAAMRIDQLAFLPAMAFGMSATTLVGQNIGAGHYDRVKQVFYWGILFCGLITLGATAVAVTGPQFLIRLFIQEPEVVKIGASYLRIVGSCYVFFAIIFVVNGVINGSGHTLATTAFSLISLWVVRVPLAAYLSERMESVEGVWWAIVASFAASMLVSLAYYMSGRWKRSVVRDVVIASSGDEEPEPALEPCTEEAPGRD